MKNRCNHINRVAVHPSVVVGGASLGQCENQALPLLVKCVEHADRDAIKIAMEQMDKELQQLRRKNHVYTWHIVTSQGGIVLGVFGSALLSEAQECARRVGVDTGFPAWVFQVHGDKPHVGQTFVREATTGEQP